MRTRPAEVGCLSRAIRESRLDLPRGAPKEPNSGYRLLRPIYPAFRMLFPNQVIRADDLARAMVNVVVQKTAEHESRVFENRDIRAMIGSFHVTSK
jgi:hypothetical protein